MGKGSKPRPVDKIKYDSNFDQINWKNHKQQLENSNPNSKTGNSKDLSK